MTTNRIPFSLIVEAEVVYEGRASSRLDRGLYLILHKPDGSIAIHGARFKALNYQCANSCLTFYRRGDEFTDLCQAYFPGNEPEFLIISTNRDETLFIAVYSVGGEIADLSYNKIILTKSERELVDKMIADIYDYLPGVDAILVETEAPTPYGNCDILVTDIGRSLHIIEVKRRIAAVSACGQAARYATYYRDECKRSVREYVAAPRLSRNAAIYCRQHGQTWIEVNFDD